MCITVCLISILSNIHIHIFQWIHQQPLLSIRTYLHNDIKCNIKQKVCEKYDQQIWGKVPGCGHHAINCQAPVCCIAQHQQHHAITIHGSADLATVTDLTQKPSPDTSDDSQIWQKYISVWNSLILAECRLEDEISCPFPLQLITIL